MPIKRKDDTDEKGVREYVSDIYSYGLHVEIKGSTFLNFWLWNYMYKQPIENQLKGIIREDANFKVLSVP